MDNTSDVLHERYGPSDDEDDMNLLDRAKVQIKTEIAEETFDVKPKVNKKFKIQTEDGEEALTKLEDNPSQVREKLDKGCECNVSCFRDLNEELVYKHRLNIAELTKPEHEMYLMGVTMATLLNRNETSRHKERQRQRTTYVYQGRKVCLYAFCYLENVTQYQLKRIRNHVLNNGVIPRTHGNRGRRPHNTFGLDLYKRVENFLRTYLNIPQTTKNIVVQSESKARIYQAYKDFEVSENTHKIMGYSTFRHFISKQFPNVKFIPKFDTKVKKEVILPLDHDQDDDILEEYGDMDMEEQYLEDADGQNFVILDNTVENTVEVKATVNQEGNIVYTPMDEEHLIYFDDNSDE